MRVFVYWNLHKGLWSVKALEGPDKGRVIKRAATVLLGGAEGRVSEAGRQRVLREKRKNVHAGIVGRLVHASDEPLETAGSLRVSYNPYKGDHFYYSDTGEAYEGSAWALLQDKGVWVS